MKVGESSFRYVWLGQCVKSELQSYLTPKLHRQFFVFSDAPQSFRMTPLNFQPGASTQLYLPRRLLIYPPCPATHEKARIRITAYVKTGRTIWIL